MSVILCSLIYIFILSPVEISGLKPTITYSKAVHLDILALISSKTETTTKTKNQQQANWPVMSSYIYKKDTQRFFHILFVSLEIKIKTEIL